MERALSAPAAGDAPMQSLLRDLVASLRNPEFWALSSWLDIVVRNRQSRLGIFWLMAPALVYIWGMGAFFAALASQPLASFVSYVAVGYLVFRVISSAIIDSTSAFSGGASFILDGHLRLTDFVLRVVSTAMFNFAVSLPVAAVALVLSPDVHWQGLGLALVTLPVVVANAIWVGVVFALAGARFPDMKHLVGNIFMFAFLLTPIIWHADAMPAGSLRGTLARLNPLYHMVELVRAPILGQPISHHTLAYLAVMTLGGWLLAMLAYRRYARYVPLWI
ncbi:MAG TPA: ABC transporter permease [Xanthomonadaceae bacterium]|jgi:ABC-type polysaccharide/polyol phosphate export permease|nr:ABC transporter permease [Xanthomonadaceae bacterium]